MDKATYAKKLKDARVAAGYTQAAVANLIGRPQPTIGAWEVGRSQPDVDTLATLLRLYNVSANDFFDYESTSIQSLSNDEQEHIKKYRTLDGYGKEIVDSVLNIEHRRCTDASFALSSEIISMPYLLQPASAGTGQIADDDIAERIPVFRNVWTAKADYALRVSGNSMEPEVHDGDTVLVRAQAGVELGEIGIFIHDNERFIKTRRADRLQSLNPDCADITPNEFTRCIGKVIGVLEPEWIAK